MKRIVLISAALLIAAPAFAQSVGEKTGINSTLGISPSTADFVKEVAISDMFELQSNKLAEERGNAAEKSDDQSDEPADQGQRQLHPEDRPHTEPDRCEQQHRADQHHSR